MGKAEMKCGLFGAVLRGVGQVMYRPCRSLDPEPGAGRRRKAHSLQSEFRGRGSIPNFQEWERVMNPMESDHEVLTVKEICDLLQVHQSTIYKMIRQGKIPTFRIGSDWRFRRDRIMRWMAERTMGAPQ